MPQGQYTAADLQQATPPPGGTGQFTAADLDTKTASSPEPGWETKAKHMATGLWNAAEMSASAPAVAYEMYKKFSGQPNQLSEMPGRAAVTFATAEEPVSELETPTATSALPVGAKDTATTLAGKILRRVPYLGKIVQFGDLASDIADAIGGKGEAPPVAKPPAAPIPETNGIPWGSGGQGPLDLRGKTIPPEAAPAVAAPPPTAPAAPVTKKAGSSAVDDALDVQPFQAKPGVPIRSQITPRSANPTAGIPAGHTAVDSSALSSFKYDPEANELHVVTNSNPKTVYVYGDVSADQADTFKSADSKGKAWAELKQQGSPLVAKIVNGTRIPVRPTPAPASVITLPAGTSEEDLSPQLQESLRRIRAARAGKQVQ